MRNKKNVQRSYLFSLSLTSLLNISKYQLMKKKIFFFFAFITLLIF